jgi:hypothetical protein
VPRPTSCRQNLDQSSLIERHNLNNSGSAGQSVKLARRQVRAPGGWSRRCGCAPQPAGAEIRWVHAINRPVVSLEVGQTDTKNTTLSRPLPAPASTRFKLSITPPMGHCRHRTRSASARNEQPILNGGGMTERRYRLWRARNHQELDHRRTLAMAFASKVTLCKRESTTLCL